MAVTEITPRPHIQSEETPKLAIMGAGTAGERHGVSFSALGWAVSFYDNVPSQSEKAVATVMKRHIDGGLKQPSLNIAEDPVEAMQGAHLIVIATPDHEHAAYARMATSLRVHGSNLPPLVFVEKPFTTTLNDALSIAYAAKVNRAVVVSGSTYSLTPVFEYVDNAIAGKRVRRIETGYEHNMEQYRVPDNWRWMQDLLFGGGSHAFVAILDAMKADKIKAVVGIRGNTDVQGRDSRFNENAILLLAFDSKAIGSVTLDGRSVPPGGKHGTKLRVACEGVTYETHNKDTSVRVSMENKVETVEVGTATTIDLLATLLTEYLRGQRDNVDPMYTIPKIMELMYVLDACERALKSETFVPVEIFRAS